MADEQKPGSAEPASGAQATRWSTTALLGGVLAIAVYGALGYRLYRALVPEIEVSLSASFEPYSRWLTVRGGAYESADPVESGSALIEFETSDPNATHSFHAPVRKGRFELDAEIEAAADRPGVLRRVTATVQSGHFGAIGVGRVLGPNEIDGWILKFVLCVWVLLTSLFVWLFTGDYSRRKQRYAIIYSYLVAAMFLIVPLAVPVVVAVVPGVGARLAQTPVGFLQVGTATTGGDGKTIAIGQWSLNIGGTPVESVPPASAPTKPKDAAQGGVSVPGVAVAAPPNDAPATPAVPAADSGDTPRASGVLAPFAHSALGAIKGALVAEPSPTLWGYEPRSRARYVSPERVDDLARVYDIKGGLVVPLYVLILATIGGAFRMTRTVPEIDRQIHSVESRSRERPAFTLRDLAAMPMRAVLAPFAGLRSQPAPPRVVAPVETNEASVTDPIVEDATSAELIDGPATTSDTAAAPKPLTPEDRLAEARRDLTHQVLFLFTSPFMGILAYYALVFVHDDFGTKTPIVAIVAFVSGIKSEDVLKKIVDLAQAAQGDAKS